MRRERGCRKNDDSHVSVEYLLVPAANQIPTKYLHWLVTLPWMQEETALREKGITETELQSQ